MGSRAPQPTFERLLRLAVRLGVGQAVTLEHIQRTYRVSLATARRDMTRLESILPVIAEDLPMPLGRGGAPSKALRLMPGSQLFPNARAPTEG